jgi:hypothetical protein
MQSSQPLGDKWKKSAYTSMSMHARLVIRSKLIARVGCAGEVCLLARRGQFQVALMVAFRFCGEFLSSFACSRIELWVWNGRFPGLEVREGEPSTTCFADISSSSLATGIKDTPCLACIRVARLVVVSGWHAGRQVQSYGNPIIPPAVYFVPFPLALLMPLICSLFLLFSIPHSQRNASFPDSNAINQQCSGSQAPRKLPVASALFAAGTRSRQSLSCPGLCSERTPAARRPRSWVGLLWV